MPKPTQMVVAYPVIPNSTEEHTAVGYGKCGVLHFVAVISEIVQATHSINTEH